MSTVAGTLLGAALGHEATRGTSPRRYSRDELRCEIVDRYVEEQRLVAYRVEYRYKGQVFVTHTDEHPGKRIPVRVDVEPVEF